VFIANRLEEIAALCRQWGAIAVTDDLRAHPV
jgi:hypothetical protein